MRVNRAFPTSFLRSRRPFHNLLCFPSDFRAIVLGRTSADTISGGIARADSFKDNAPAFAYGMTIVLWLGFFWQYVSAYTSSPSLPASI